MKNIHRFCGSREDKVGRPDIDAFEAPYEIGRFRRKEGREIKPLTVREILDEEILPRQKDAPPAVVFCNLAS
jgi:hypothetical protein